MRTDLPSGTVTFLFTDVEGSTRLLHELGAEAYAAALSEHRRILREAFSRHAGVEVDTQGDAFFIAFPTAPGAVAAARQALEGLASGPIRVRMGLHTGTPHLTAEGYVGPDVHRAARIAAAGHGGQVLVSAATAALLGTASLRDLGEHRLKDLSAPERIYQSGEQEFPPLRTLHQSNLPIPATPFLGREQELAELASLLRRDDVRLLTLTGPGGTGKTRLALQAAADLAEAFAGGVWWVPLASLRDPALVLETARHALGAKQELAEHVGDRSMLLLFDNFEQVVAAATDIASLLERCPRLAVLVTSREALRIKGEWEYAVDPLREAEAVALFETRARAARRDFAADGEVQQICRRLDNLPLAIELAAARTKVLSPRALLERLERRLPVLAAGSRDAPERQRTLRATIEWSYELLSADEQRLFRRLSVFGGGWTLEAAEAICDADLDTLQALVEKSLIRQREDRYSMLETIREHAAERLEASGEAEALRRRHAEHFLALGERHASTLLSAHAEPALDVLEPEHDNVRAALDRLEAACDTERAMRLAGSVFELWCLRGHVPEGYGRLERLLLMDERATPARARALLGAAHLGIGIGVQVRSRWAEEAMELNARLGDEWGVAFAEYGIAGDMGEQGDFAAARPLLESCVARFQALGDEHRALMAMRTLAWACGGVGDRTRQIELYEEILTRARAHGDRAVEARALAFLGRIAVREGRLEDGLARLKQAYRLNLEGARRHLADELVGLADLLSGSGKAEPAAMALGRADALRQELGEREESWVADMRQSALERIRARLKGAALEDALQRGRAIALDDAYQLAFARLGEAAPAAGDERHTGAGG